MKPVPSTQPLNHNVKTVKIDDREFGAGADQTILEIAREAKIPISDPVSP